MLDPRGQVISWSAGAELIEGYTAEEIIGHNFARFFVRMITSEVGRRRYSG